MEVKDGETQCGRQKERQTDKQTDRPAHRQTDKQTDRRTHRKTERLTDRQTNRQAGLASHLFFTLSGCVSPFRFQKSERDEKAIPRRTCS